MAGYDRGWDHPFQRGGGGRPRRYDARYGSAGWGEPGPEGGWSWGAGRGPGGRSGWEWEWEGYDRGPYGAAYPAYGGYPGEQGRGMYYGGRGYDRSYGQRAEGPSQRAAAAWAFAPGPRHPAGSDDDELRESVRHSLFNDSWLDAERIDVEVRDGVVTLTGEVESYLQARYAWDDAWETAGVHGVVDRLRVRAGDAGAGGAEATDSEEP